MGLDNDAMETEGRNDSDLDIDLPNSLIVTNVPELVFDDDVAKETFEGAFKNYEENATFQYLKSFRRARVNFSSPDQTAQARIEMQETELCGGRIRCYFVQVMSPDSETRHLKPPKPDKQFLLSPPASPPVDWEPVHENTPTINYELLSALARLAPGEAHQLHPGTHEHPAIVVHVCEDPEGYIDRPQIEQTRCPDRT